MASPAFRQAFAQWPEVSIKEAMEQTIINIIDMDYKSNPRHLEQEWYKVLRSEGIHISYVTYPCELHTVPEHNKVVAESELRMVFEKAMWKHVEPHRVARAICISHLRALGEAMAQNKKASCIIVLEGDVESNGSNTIQLMASFCLLYTSPSPRD